MKMWMPADFRSTPCDRSPVGNHAAVAEGHELVPALKTTEIQATERKDRQKKKRTKD